MPNSLNDIVRVTASIAEQGLLRREFGIGLFLTKDQTLGTGSDAIGVFADADDIDSVFADGTEPQEAGNIWFQQDPFPRNLYVGRFFNVADEAKIFGGVHTTLAALQAISDGSFQMNGEDLTAINLSGASSFADVATALQTKLQAATDVNLTSATVEYNAVDSRFEMQNNVTGSTSTLTFASAAASGTDISALIGWTEAVGANLDQGVDAESVADALNRLRDLNSDWYFVMPDSAFTDEEKREVSDWVEPREYMAPLASSAAAVLTTGETASLFAQLNTLGVDRTFGDYTPAADPYLHVSSAARLSSINFNQANSLINPAFKSRPGINPATLTSTQRTELDRKRVNYFTSFAGDNIYVLGTMFRGGVWQDVRYWLDWFVDAVRVEVYNLLRQSRRVPQTNDGQVAIQNAIELICKQGINNGGIAPGQLSPALTLDIQQSTNNNAFDGFLPRGYLVYWTPLSLQSQADRNARKASPFQVWLKGSGAINSVDISILFEN